jgi:hypothetical protein
MWMNIKDALHFSVSTSIEGLSDSIKQQLNYKEQLLLIETIDYMNSDSEFTATLIKILSQRLKYDENNVAIDFIDWSKL